MAAAAPAVDRFQLKERLGRGSLAMVFRAVDLVEHRDVAVKVATEPGRQHLERIQHEAGILAALDHPSIIGLVAAGVMPAGGPLAGLPFLAEELALGASLSEIVRAAPRCPADVVPWAVGVFAALSHVHGRGLVHCDIKPANLMLSGLRRSPVRIVDFGVACPAGAAPRAGISSGTVLYMSPEQAAGGAAQPAWDVYAMGLVLLELLTGKKAYPGTAVESLVARTLRSPEIPETFGAGWGSFLRALTAMDPGERPSAAEAAGLAARLLPGPQPEPAGRSGRLPWFPHRRQRLPA